MNELDSIREVLPSIGYFGGTATDFLEISVNDEILEVEIKVDEEEQCFLNLRGIEFYRNNRRLEIRKFIDSIKQSSFRESDSTRDPYSLLSRGGCHTDRELNPKWKIKFNQNIFISSIRIYNRTDGWGIRARNLRISTLSSSGSSNLYGVGSTANKQHAIDYFSKLLNINSLDFCELFMGSVDSRQRLSSLTAVYLESELDIISRDESNLLATILPTGKSDDWLESDFYIAARILFDQKRRVPSASTGIKSFSFVLNTRSKLSRLQSEIERLCSKTGVDQLQISRHGISYAGALRRNRNETLATIRKVVLELQRNGIRALLGYGTLLGAVREGSFIFHDDDIDLIVCVHGSTEKELYSELNNIQQILERINFSIKTLPSKHYNFHITDKSSGSVLDLFPVLIDGEQAWLHMEKMIWRSLPSRYFVKSELVELHEQLFPAPFRPEEFLQERYGSDWAVPDPYYEWTWRLSS
ncbi:LicD family protein [Glutamicibacter sp. MNS18]|uniref:LicD family protein n=1 Tax=Glutamicibacter sp. MNS18 TaxID=2989817 RepID=UPI0022358433|nr:LicD family protein [Glutamicibacter sp. MNS18]MCW4466169.1 LicD family protein [Glutamicibacter sp. MNS18]